MTYRLFAVTLPGLEPCVQRELTDLGFAPHAPKSADQSGEPSEEAGGLEFETSLEGLFRANLQLRCANRILARLGDFYAAAFSELRKKASRLPWEQYLRPGQPVAVRVTCRQSKLYHSDAVAERIAGAVGDKLGQPSALVKFDPETDRPAPLIVVRLVRDMCSVSIDTSGALLHRRGYRLAAAKAPLRETLAAGLLLSAGWNPAAPLLDPFCGSGTIAIEAARLTRRIAPGVQRRYAFMSWKTFDQNLWHQTYTQAAQLQTADCPPIIASDRDEGAVQSAQANAERAGVLENIRFSTRAFSAVEPPPGPGWVITNPPYGVRVQTSRDLRDLYAALGNVLRRSCPGWQYGILSSSPELIHQTRLQIDSELPLLNGGLPVRFYTGRIS